MKRVFVSYAAVDREAALFVTTHLRNRNIDVFFDYERMMSQGRFTRRMANEIESRDCLILIQSPAALVSEQVQKEIRHAQAHDIHIIPMTIELISIRDTSEFAYLLHTRPIDFTGWKTQKTADIALDQLENILMEPADKLAISVANVSTLRELSELHGHTSWVRRIKFSPDGALLASCSNDNTVVVWNTRRHDFMSGPPQMLARVSAHDASMWSVDFSPDGRFLATCSNDNMVRIWSLADLPELYEYTRFIDHHAPVYDLSFSPDGRILGSASHDDTVHLRDVSRMAFTGRADTIVPLRHVSHVYSLSFSPNSDMVASASRDSTIRLWRLDPKLDLRDMMWSRPDVLTGHSSWVNTVTFSPVGPVLASTSHDNTIRLWDTINMECIGILQGHRDAVNTVAFSPDGRILVSAAKDKTVRLWDIATQRELISLGGHTQWVNSAVFSPDGSVLATAGGDNIIKFWGVDQVAGQKARA